MLQLLKYTRRFPRAGNVFAFFFQKQGIFGKYHKRTLLLFLLRIVGMGVQQHRFLLLGLEPNISEALLSQTLD